MNVLILGANGQLGPYVVKALEGKHTLRLTDINDLDDTPHEYIKVDVSDIDAVEFGLASPHHLTQSAIRVNDAPGAVDEHRPAIDRVDKLDDPLDGR